MSGRRGWEAWLPWLPVIGSLAAQSHVLAFPFFADDYIHLFDVANGPLHRVLLAPHGGHLLITYNAAWWLLHGAFGDRPLPYFVAVLVGHALNVWLLFGIVRELTGSGPLAALGATLWGMSPQASGTLEWLSVLGHVVATTAVLWVLFDLVRIRPGARRIGLGSAARWYALLLVAATSFGTGLSVAVCFGAILFLWNPDPPRRVRLSLAFASLVPVIAALYAAAFWLWQAWGGVPDSPKTGLILPHLGDVLQASWSLVAFGFSGLVLGPLLVGRLAVVPPEATPLVTSAVAVAGLCGLAALARAATPEQRGRLAALALVPIASYGMIAAARFWVVGVASQLRFHYLPPAALTVLGCLFLAWLAPRVPRVAARGPLVTLVVLAVVAVPWAWGSRHEPDAQRLRVALRHEQTLGLIHRRILRAPPGEPSYLKNHPFPLELAGEVAETRFPGWAALFAISHRSDVFRDRLVRFVEPDPATFHRYAGWEGSRMASLLVEEAPPHDAPR